MNMINLRYSQGAQLDIDLHCTDEEAAVLLQVIRGEVPIEWAASYLDMGETQVELISKADSWSMSVRRT